MSGKWASGTDLISEWLRAPNWTGRVIWPFAHDIPQTPVCRKQYEILGVR